MEIGEAEQCSLELSGELRGIEIGKNPEIFSFELDTCLHQLALEVSDNATWAGVDVASNPILVSISIVTAWTEVSDSHGACLIF